MDKVEELRRLLRKDEYDQEEKQNSILTENANSYTAFVKKSTYDMQAPLRLMKNKCEFMKEVICECMANLYESSLIIDNVDKYSDSLRQVCKDQCKSIMETCNRDKDLHMMFENASPYIRGVLALAEAAYDAKDSDEIKAFEDKIILSKDDFDLINKFEQEEGKDVYANDIQDRIVDVYKAEEELGQKQKEKVQAVVDELAKIKSTGAENENDAITESIESGCNLFNSTPQTIFSSIFINKSKQFLQETASPDLEENGEKILAETIATYTLLETIHALGFKTYNEDEKRQLRMSFFIS